VKTEFDAKYVLGHVFNTTLNEISYSLTKQIGDMNEPLANAWKKFQEILPELYVKNAVAVANIENILAAETKKI